MKLNITIVVSFLSSLFALLGFTCNALPIWANFAREYQGDHAISPPPQPTSTFDIYGKELLSADGKAFPSSLAYYTESSLKQPFWSSSGFLLLPNSVTASSLPDSPSRQTVFIDINGSVVKMDEPSQGSFLSRSATRSTSWVRALRKRDEGETFEPQIVPSKFERLGGAAKLMTISPAPSLHYNQMNGRSRERRAVFVKAREEEEEQEVSIPIVVAKGDSDKEQEEQRVIDECKQFEEKGLLPLGSCQQHHEIRDYADSIFKRDLVETVEKASSQNKTMNNELSLSLLKDMETRLQADLTQVQKAMQLMQSKGDPGKGPPPKTDAEKAKKDNDDGDDDDDDDDDDEDDEEEDKKTKESKEKKDEKTAEKKEEKKDDKAKEQKKSIEDDED